MCYIRVMDIQRESSTNDLSADDRRALLELARDSIRAELEDEDPPTAEGRDVFELERAVFVTVNVDGELRGCIGNLHSQTVLGEDVQRNAIRAALHDPRFPPLSQADLPRLDIHLSVLGDLHPIQVADEQELCERLRPGVDGLVIDDGAHRATFLPAVWEKIPDAPSFVRALKRKAGLHGDRWPPTMRVALFHVEEFGTDDHG